MGWDDGGRDWRDLCPICDPSAVAVAVAEAEEAAGQCSCMALDSTRPSVRLAGRDPVCGNHF